MLIQRIAPNYLNKSSNTHLKKQYRQNSNTAVSYAVFDKTSFCGIRSIPVTSPLAIRRGGLARKIYRILTGEDLLFLNIGEHSKLGKEPVICYSYRDEEQIIEKECAKKFGIDETYKAKWLDVIHEMDKDGDVFSAVASYAKLHDKLRYAIFYKDTKKWDNNHGKGYEIEPLKVINRAISFDKGEHSQSLLRIIRRGTTKGKVVVNDTLSELLRTLPKSDEPVIAVVDDFTKKGENDSLGNIPSNVKSVIFTKPSKCSLTIKQLLLQVKLRLPLYFMIKRKLRHYRKWRVNLSI